MIPRVPVRARRARARVKTPTGETWIDAGYEISPCDPSDTLRAGFTDADDLVIVRRADMERLEERLSAYNGHFLDRARDL